jgi:hypothetical protein
VTFDPLLTAEAATKNQLSPKNSLKAGLKNAERSFVGSMREKEKETSLMKEAPSVTMQEGIGFNDR